MFSSRSIPDENGWNIRRNTRRSCDGRWHTHCRFNKGKTRRKATGNTQHSTEQERAEWSSTLRSYSVARPKWFFLRIVDQGWMKAISMWSDTSEKYDATIQKNFHLEEIRQEGCRMELVSWAWESIRWNQQHNHRRFRSFTAVLRSS